MAKMDSLVSGMRQFSEYTKQAEASIAKMVRQMSASSGGGNAGGGNNGAVPEGTSAANPSFNTSSSGGGSNGFGSMLGVVAKVASVGGTMMSQALGSPQDYAAYQLSTSRAGFFSGQSYATTAAQQLNMARNGTITNKNDPLQIQAGLQAGGVYNLNQVMGGVTALTNYNPALGGAAGAAAASMNQGKSVNMLNMLGISVRGANGMMNDPNTLINEFVQKIWDTTPPLKSGDSAQAMAYLMGALQPGNQLYFILNTYFTDENMKNLVITKLMAKAKGLPANASRDQLIKAGLSTPTAKAMSNYNAAQLNLTQQTTEGVLSGTDAALNHLTSITNSIAGYAKALEPLLKAYGYASTMLGGLNGAIGTLAGSVAMLASSILGGGLGGSGGMSGLAGGVKGLGVAAAAAGTAYNGYKEYQAGKQHKGFNWGGAILTTLGDAAAGFLVGGPAGAAWGAGIGITSSAGAYYAGTTQGQASGGNSHGTAPMQGGANLIAGGTPPGAASLINAASSVLGTPYAWGGGGPNGPTVGVNQGAGTVGFDCSSLVQFVFAKQGINLPRTTYAQVKCGKAVMPRNAVPGDLLFFGNPEAPEHVGIYIGNGQMIQAPHSGGNVEISAVNLGGVSACRRVLTGGNGSIGASSLFSSTTMDAIGLPGQSVGGGGGVSGAAGTTVGGGGANVLTSVGSHGLTSAASATNGTATASGGGITINVTVPATSSPNSAAQTTKVVTAAVQQAIGQSSARTN